MTRVRPTAVLGNLGRQKNATASTYITTCKLCPAGVYLADPRVWLRKPAGWSHEACAKREGLA